MLIASYFQSSVAIKTASTICPAVRVGPEAILRGSRRPVANTFTLVPPTSMTRTFIFMYLVCCQLFVVRCYWMQQRQSGQRLSDYPRATSSKLLGKIGPSCRTLWLRYPRKGSRAGRGGRAIVAGRQ